MVIDYDGRILDALKVVTWRDRVPPWCSLPEGAMAHFEY